VPSSAWRAMMVTANTVRLHDHTLVAAAAKASSRMPSNAASTALMNLLEMLSVCLPRAHRAHTAMRARSIATSSRRGVGAHRDQDENCCLMYCSEFRSVPMRLGVSVAQRRSASRMAATGSSSSSCRSLPVAWGHTPQQNSMLPPKGQAYAGAWQASARSAQNVEAGRTWTWLLQSPPWPRPHACT